MMSFDEIKRFMLAVQVRFYDILPSLAGEYPGLISYEMAEEADSVCEDIIWYFGVASSIKEAINCTNAWCQQLHAWNVWLHVLDNYSGDEHWELESSTVEPIAFYCMLQPATNFDRLLEVVEDLLHQTNRIVISDYKDRLDQDELPNGRRQSAAASLKQLDRLGSHWSMYQRFKDLHRQINGAGYEGLTSDFRNRSLHSLSSRWTRGEVMCATRSVVPWKEMIQQQDGTFLPVPHSTKKAVQYGLGSRMPLVMRDAYDANLKQYRLVQKTMTAFATLVAEVVSAIKAKHASAHSND